MSELDHTVTLRPITKDNLHDILHLQVAPHQEQFVASNAVSLAQAHFEPELPWFRAIYADAMPIGFLMLEYDSKDKAYNLWRFMIDAHHQGVGYGRKALELLFEHVKTLPGADVLYTHCVLAEGGPSSFYEKMGFVSTGEQEGGGLWMRRAM